MSADKDISRKLSSINAEVKLLDTNIKDLTTRNKLLDKSMQLNSDPFSVLEKKSESLSTAIEISANKLSKLKEKQKIVEEQFKNNDATQHAYDSIINQVIRAENEFANLQGELHNTEEAIHNIVFADLQEDIEIVNEKIEENIDEQQSLQTELVKSSDKFKATGDAVKEFGNKLTAAGRAFAPFSAGAAGFLAVGAKTTKSAIEQGAAIDDLAQRYQVSALTVQRWQYVAMQCGVEAEGLTKAYVKARAAMLDLDSGKINEQSEAVASLGINIKDFSNSEEAFEGILAALAGMENGTRQVTLANEIFGDKLANTLLPLLNAGEDNLKMFTDQFAELNPLTDEQVTKLAALDDQMYKNKETLKNTALQIGTSLTPVVQALLNIVEEKVVPKMKAIAEHFQNMSDRSKTFAVGILFVIAALAPLLMVGGKVIGGIGSLISLIPKLSGMLTVLSAHPIIAIIGIIAVLIGMLYMKNEQFRKSVNNMLQMFSKLAMPIMNVVMSSLSSIFQLIGGLLNVLSGPFVFTLDLITSLLQPIVNIIAWLINGINEFISGVKKVISFGLWDDKKSTKSQSPNFSTSKYEAPKFDFNTIYGDVEVPDFNSTATNYNSSATTDNYNIQNDIVINAADMDAKELEEAISKAFNKQMLSKYLAFR